MSMSSSRIHGGAAAGRGRSDDVDTVIVITKGLDEGQTVVTDGQSRLQDGTKVAVNDASQQAAAPAKPAAEQQRSTGSGA